MELLSKNSEEKYGRRKLSMGKVRELNSFSELILTQHLLCGHEGAMLQALGQSPGHTVSEELRPQGCPRTRNGAQSP